MIRWSVLAAGTVAFMGVAFVTGASVPAKAVRPPAEADAPRPPLVIGQKTGYFNMAKVMRESQRAKTGVARLTARRERLAANLVGLRNMLIELQAVAQNPKADPKQKYEAVEGTIKLGRQIEDTDRALQKVLNDRASVIISEIHDDLRAVAAEVARENALAALLAHPDAVTREEAENPLIKELKLKPPALLPFYLDASVDFTDEIVRRMNEKFLTEVGE